MDIFAIIADPTRRAMLQMLTEQERAAGEFVAAFPAISQPAISQHLKVLRDGGLVSVRTDKQRRFYSLLPSRFDIFREWLDGFTRVSMTPEPVKPVRRKAPEPKPQPHAEPATLDLFG